ncbi:MAG TPA: hypothetical protein VGT61_10755 [Thermomicrobiales bacterium]|jgi:hypothetical protein|nr:hypothetical protein [Thermomicrobiales bacterium]
MTRFGTTRRASWRGTIGRGLAVGAMVLGGLTAAISPAAAEEDTAYASTIGDGAWNVAWDSTVWESDEEIAENFGIDLILSRQGASVWFFTMEDQADGPTCLEEVGPLYEEMVGITDSEPFVDEDGEQVGYADEATARSFWEIEMELEDGTVTGFGYHSCWTIEEGSTAIFAGSLLDTAELEENAGLVDDLFAAVGTQFDGETVVEDGIAAGAGSGSDDPVEDDPAPSEDIPAGADADNGTYRSPEFGFTTSWDPADWDVTLEVLGEEANGRDLIRLDETDGTSAAFVEGGTNWEGDLETCMESLASDIALDLDDTEPIEDPETGDPFVIEDDDQLGAGFLFDFTGEGEEPNIVVVLACQALDDDVVVGVTHISDDLDAYFDEDFPLFEELFGNISAGEASDDTADDPAPSDEGSDRGDARDDGEATPDSGTEERESTPETGTDETGGVYVSPTYFYFLAWDTTIWESLNEASSGGTDSLSLVSENLQADLIGYEDGAGDVVGCVEDLTATLGDAYGGAEIFERDNGDLITVSDDGTQAFALITYSADGVQSGTIVTCHQISGEAVVYLAASGPVDILVDQTDDVTALLAGLLVIPAE